MRTEAFALDLLPRTSSPIHTLLPGRIQIRSCTNGMSGSDPVNLSARTSARQRVSGNLSAEYGTFYNGHKTAVSVGSGRVNLSPRFSLEPNVSLNWIDLPRGAFTTTLAGLRVTYTMTPLMFVSALVQYNSGTRSVSTNARLRWEYQPGSELFVVYNEERDTLARRFPEIANRALIVKVNRLMRF